MSKKIKIPSNNIKSHLVDLFHSFISRKHKSDSASEYYDEELLWLMQQGYVFNEDDEDIYNYYDDDDDCDVIWPLKGGKNGKKSGRTAQEIYDEFWGHELKKSKHKHSKKYNNGKARVISITQPYSGNEEDPDELGYDEYEDLGDDNGIMDGKEIYYYPDYRNKDNRIEFNSLKSFNEFCSDNGYKVPEHVGEEIMYRRVSHTCLRPDVREYGLYEIAAEESYGVLAYEVCDPSELSNL